MKALLAAWLFVLCKLPSAYAGTLSAVLTPDPNPPTEGANSVQIILKDGDAPLVGARVSLVASMPAMGTMPRMESPADLAERGDGQYDAHLTLGMGGTWELTLTVDRGGQPSILRYSLTTGVPGVQNKNGSGPALGAEVLDLGPERTQRIGVRLAVAKPRRLEREIRAVALVEQDKTHREEVALRYGGYVAAQIRGRIGDQVKRGDPLFRIYSPELVAAQSDFLLAQQGGEGVHPLHESSAERLKNLGLGDAEIKAVKAAGKAQREVTIRAPLSGTILEINAREGAAVEAGQVLYVIGDLTKTYLVARVFQQDLADLKAGQKADVLLPGTGTRVAAKVDLVYPSVEAGAGTGNVRIEAGTFNAALVPGVYADVRFPVDLGERLAIPVEAVLHSGLHTYVFVDGGNGAFAAREIETGKRAGDLVEERSGLTDGERVAASGTFLLGSEAQLRSALPRWSTP
jgi:Cu(I)/Ag(I) efflux system membrane fusion protein